MPLVDAGTALAAVATLACAAAVLLAWRRPAMIVDRPRTVLATIAAISLVAAWSLVDFRPPGFRITLDPSEEPMLAAGDPARPVYDAAVQNFGDDDVFVIGMSTDDVFTRDHLQALRRVSEAIRVLPGVRAAESLADTVTYRYRPEPDLVEVDRFIDAIPDDPSTLAALRRRALDDRLYRKTLISTDGRTAAINVSFRAISDRAFVDTRLDERIQEILTTEASDGRRFFVTGRQHIKSRAARLMVADLLKLIPLAVIVGTVVASVAMGSLPMALIPVGASLIATLWVFGALAFLEQPLNLVTIVLGPMLICIGSIYGVHVYARYDVLVRASGSPRDAALGSLRDTLLPNLISAFTTAIGFAALLVSDAPAIWEFSMYSLLGVAAIVITAVAGIPATLSMLPPPRDVWSRSVSPSGGISGSSADSFRGATPIARRPSGNISRLFEALLERITALSTHRPVAVLTAWTLLTVAALAAVPRIVVDTDYLTFFDPRSDVRRDFAAVSERLVGAVPLYVVLAGGTEGAFREPENLRALERVQARVETVPGVSATLSLADFVKKVNHAVEREDPSAERIPATREEIADLLFLMPKNKLRRFANANHSSVNLLVRTGVSGSAAVRDLQLRIEEAIAAAGLPPGIAANVTGNSIVLNRAADGIAGNQLSSVGLTALTIFILVTLAFRSLKVGVIAIVPNVVPVALFFGLLGAGMAKLSLPTSLIGSIALGISIDDTAHFIVGYQRRRTSGLDPAAAAADTIGELGRPIVVTAVMEIAGYLVLALSGFTTIREFGYLSALTMLICLCADLLMLPALLVRARI